MSTSGYFFSGEHHGKVDAKGRLVLPARLKTLLLPGERSEVVLRMGFEPNLILYPSDAYALIHERVRTLGEFDPQSRAFKRNFFRGVVPLSVDGLGRILLPRGFMQYAGIVKEVVIVGVGDMVEIWDKQQYEQHLIRDQQAYSRLAKELLHD